MVERIDLDWMAKLPDKPKGRIGTAIAESYLIRNIPKNPGILHPDFRNREVRVSHSERNEYEGISYLNTGPEDSETLTWIPDGELRILEDIDWEERMRRRETDDEPPRIEKTAFVEVKTSTTQRTPASRIPDNQSKLARILTQNEDDIVLAVLLTLKSDHILIEPYTMDDGKWTEIDFSDSG